MYSNYCIIKWEKGEIFGNLPKMVGNVRKIVKNFVYVSAHSRDIELIKFSIKLLYIPFTVFYFLPVLLFC